MLLRLTYLTVTKVFAILRLLPASDRDKNIEILALRHQITVRQRQLGPERAKFAPADRALLAALLRPLPHEALRRLLLLVPPDTILRWHRDLLTQRRANASRPHRPGRPRTARSIRLLILRLASENPSWGYRSIHGELTTLGIKIAASTVWEILKAEGIEPAPGRATTAMPIVTEVGDISLFPSARKLAFWAGLTPTVRGSDRTVRYGHISKQGDPRLRWIMNQVAQTAKLSP